MKYRYLIWTSRVYSCYASEDTNILISMILFEYIIDWIHIQYTCDMNEPMDLAVNCLLFSTFMLIQLDTHRGRLAGLPRTIKPNESTKRV